MPTQIKLPALGENIDSGDVLSILVAEGDVIAKDQDLLEIETDKATMPVPSPAAGKIVKILVSEGDTVVVGAPLFDIEGEAAGASGPSTKDGAKVKAEVGKQKSDSQPATNNGAGGEESSTDEELEATSEESEEREEWKAKKPSPPTKAQGSRVGPPPPESVPVIVEPEPKAPAVDMPGDGHASAAAGPAVRRLARVLGVDLRRVRPSGDNGRITEDDVRQHVRKSQAEAEAKVSKGVTPPGMADSDGYGGIRREKMSRIRQTIARNMLASYTTIPQLTNFDEVDVTELEHIRKESQDDYAKKGAKLTTMPFLVKAVAVALKHHPILNASVADDQSEIIYKEYVNIGIAVDTERGLVVPVLRDADRKNIPQIAAELAKIAEGARKGSFGVEDLRGGTFTISNLGAVGGTYSTPLINPPEAAVLLAGRSRMMPLYVDDEFQPRLMLPLSITYDHRIVDGAAAARFLNDVKGYLANPGRLLLAP